MKQLKSYWYFGLVLFFRRKLHGSLLPANWDNPTLARRLCTKKFFAVFPMQYQIWPVDWSYALFTMHSNMQSNWLHKRFSPNSSKTLLYPGYKKAIFNKEIIQLILRKVIRDVSNKNKKENVLMLDESADGKDKQHRGGIKNSLFSRLLF